MGFLNLGEKDEYGRQRRIEHRGKHLRASRTGGVALRAQTKAAGLNFTANTSQGLRVSATPARNTQVALQNGRFVLRGRYGSGPFKLNLSKSGFSVSARNALGSVNLTNPMRSSAKVAGIQFRGKTAAWLQGIYGLISLVLLLARLAIVLALLAWQVVLFVVGGVLGAAAAVPGLWREARRRVRTARLGRAAKRLERHIEGIDEWTADRWIAALLLVVGARGRGMSAAEAAPGLARSLEGDDAPRGLAVASAALREAGAALDEARRSDGSGVTGDLALVVVVARRLKVRLPVGTLGEILLEVDELALEAGPRTRLQDRMLEVFADAAGLRLETVAEQSTAAAVGEREGRRDAAAGAAIDLNAASVEALQALPHVGPERARGIVAMRPLERVEQLAELDGIGPARLREIRAYGVVCAGD